jgi:hypothetical protein
MAKIAQGLQRQRAHRSTSLDRLSLRDGVDDAENRG